jgi:hypothetical protein
VYLSSAENLALKFIYYEALIFMNVMPVQRQILHRTGVVNRSKNRQLWTLL